MFLQRTIAIDETGCVTSKPNWNLRVRFGKQKFTTATKFQHPASKMKQGKMIAYDYTGIITTYNSAVWLYSKPTLVCIHFLCKILRPKVNKRIHKCSIVWSVSMTTLIRLLQCRLLCEFLNNLRIDVIDDQLVPKLWMGMHLLFFWVLGTTPT